MDTDRQSVQELIIQEVRKRMNKPTTLALASRGGTRVVLNLFHVKCILIVLDAV